MVTLWATTISHFRYGHGACVGEDGRLFVFGGTHDPEIVHMLGTSYHHGLVLLKRSTLCCVPCILHALHTGGSQSEYEPHLDK